MRRTLCTLLMVCALTLLAAGCASGQAPDLIGATAEEAAARAQEAGLQLVTAEEVPYFLAAGTVLAQDPLPGIKPVDGTIKVTVSREPIPVQITNLVTYDPEGNGRENDNQLRNLTDGDPSTSWSSERYVSPIFVGLGLKTGVGMRFWLSEPATMIKVTHSLMGWKGEVQKVLDGGLVVAVAQLGQTEQVSLSQPLSQGRIWFYEMAPMPDGDRHGVILEEIAFYR